ncbi:hypothetical protein [Engelhardtia mirabilis]|uniref:Uncharacterized protein n=1 Tax=Engelhardtia mirabilis TaxID=2528011 RepID=A0A518BRC9_9BACT|nr:hypothetical protein Pla133_46410 [Planctomycetes bacterium Pla133]QDV03847.1 hypothetical protein Pla86_46390 [Planctomycetes bacterium Pla86]
MIRLALPLGLASAALLFDAPTELSTDYARKVTWKVSSERSFSLETLESSMEIDGEPVERGGMGGGGSEDVRAVSFTHTILEHAAGEPTAVRRVFGEVAGEGLMRFGENEMETTAESPFEGAEIEWRMEDGTPVAEVIDGDVEEEGLDAFTFGLALDNFLPAGEVEPDATWELDGELFLQALGLDLEATLFPPAPPEESEEGGRGGGRRGGFRGGRSGGIDALLGLDWDVEVTFAEASVDSDWGPAARLTFEAEGSGDPPARGGRGGPGGGGGESSTEGSVTANLEGELLFLLDGRHPVHFECGGTVGIESTTIRSTGRGEMVMTNVQEGQLSLAITVEQVIEDDGE